MDQFGTEKVIILMVPKRSSVDVFYLFPLNKGVLLKDFLDEITKMTANALPTVDLVKISALNADR